MDDDIRKRREDTRRQIESNDPDLTKLTIDTYQNNYLPHDGDWARDGKGIGRNEYIKELCFDSGMASAIDRTDFEAFCAGLACNKSIEKLVIPDCALFGGEIFNFLIPFFQQNTNLQYLGVSGGILDLPNGVRWLSESLSRFNTLRVFECLRCQLLDNELETLIQALAGHSKLGKIDLGGNKLGERGINALAALLNPNSTLADLNLFDCSINDEGAVVFADALGRNCTLKKLNLGGNGNITASGWNAIFTHLQSPHSVLENLKLSNNSIDNTAAILLGNTLTSNTHLKALSFSNIRTSAFEGWRSIFEALESPRCVLQELDIGCNNLRDEVVTHLANSLSSNCVLSSLLLHQNGSVTSSGWSSFSSVLHNPNSELEKIDLGYNSIDDDAVVSFANSLVNNNKLKELFLDGDWGFEAGDEDDDEEEGGVPITNWDALTNVLCNVSSINETYASNHTLQRVFDPDNNEANVSQLPSDLITLLVLNFRNTKIEAARRKILKVHFSGNFNMQPFVDMDLKAVPYAIAWMARDEYGSSLLYQFVRYTTFFVGLGGVESG